VDQQQNYLNVADNIIKQLRYFNVKYFDEIDMNKERFGHKVSKVPSNA